MTRVSFRARHVLIAMVALVLSAVVVRPVHAQTESEMAVRVAEALARFEQQVPQAREYLEIAEGILVIPEARKAALVFGGLGGKGALRVDGETIGYYRMAAGSVGLQAGYEKADFVFLFLTEDALEDFRTSRGWTAGVDAGVTVIGASAGVSADTLKNRGPVAAVVYGEEGLMAGISVEGTKFTPFVPEAEREQ